MSDRYYEINGQKYPSVTTIIHAIIPHPELAAWRERVGAAEAERISKEASDFGTLIHSGCEIIHRLGEIPPPSGDERQDAMLAGYHSWWCDNVAETIAAEQVVYHVGYRFAGRFDLLAQMADGSVALIDLKTGANHYQEHGLQTAAYALAARELGLVTEPCRRLVVRIDKKSPGKVDVKEYTQEIEERMFLYCAALFHYINNGGKK